MSKTDLYLTLNSRQRRKQWLYNMYDQYLEIHSLFAA